MNGAADAGHPDPRNYLASTGFVDADHPRVQAFAAGNAAHESDDLAKAVALYYAVRDGFRYDPYRIRLTRDGLCASSVLDKGYGWCVTKAVLLAAACRALSIPARLGFADVRNHLSTERMRRAMKTDVFYYHGYCAIRLRGRWVKATPAFNIELCRKFRLKPLEFDGFEDSIYHPYDEVGNRHMEYLRFRGEYCDLPLDDIARTFRKHYPNMQSRLAGGDFDADTDSPCELDNDEA